MIDRSEILAIAGDLSLAADIVEKDYALGWLLAGIYTHDDIASAWTFKGGTCLKKCYFETYRFSEDLDFTISDEAHLDSDRLRAAFTDISAWVYDETGLEIPTDQLRFDIYRNRRGGLSCQGRIYYNGPLRRRTGSLPRIKLDLTIDEVLVLPPVERSVSHPYSDLPEGGIIARCYAYEEVFGEKVRALAERTRPRDLYDVVNLFRHGEFRPAARAVLDVLRRKCAFKGISVPTFADFTELPQELIADWQAMLGHQLPTLPPFDSFWAELPNFFAWLETGAAVAAPAAAPVRADEQVIRPPIGFLRRQGIGGASFLETIRFAAGNRLCVELDYVNEQGQRGTRMIEPYSLRRSNAGAILLFAVRADTAQSRSYRLDRIQGARASDTPFTPRYIVELTPTAERHPAPLSRRRRSPRILTNRIRPGRARPHSPAANSAEDRANLRVPMQLLPKTIQPVEAQFGVVAP